MMRPLAILALIVAGLAAWDRALRRDARQTRAARSRVGRLLSPERRAELPIAAIRVEYPSGREHLFARGKGRWRSLDYHQAPADARAIGGLVEALSEAEGMVRSTKPEEAAEYGISSARSIRISFCGPRVLEDPGRDVLEAFDLGLPIPGREGCFVRRRGSPEIWAIDRNPHTFLAWRPLDGLPPLLEHGVIAGSWEGWRGVERITLEHPGAGANTGRVSLELLRVPREIAPEELRAGASPFAWVMDPGGAPVDAAERPATSFLAFLNQIPYVAVVDAARRDELVGEIPLATLAVSSGEPAATVRLALGVPFEADGAPLVPIWNGDTLYLVTPETGRLLQPDQASFLDAETDPWRTILEQAR